MMTIGVMRDTEISGESSPPYTATRALIRRSDTELALERFFEEVSPPPSISAPAVSEASRLSSDDDDDVVAIEKPDFQSTAQIDSDEYHRFLRNKLFMECAAVARTLDSSMKSGDSVQLGENRVHVSRPAQLGICVGVQGTVPAISQLQNETPCGSTCKSALPDAQNKQVRQTSESSREESDYELERDTETTNKMGRPDEKRDRRMLSNRESARRSRRRKQVLLSELEAQAEQLRNEKKELVEHQNSCDRKYSEAAVEHRILNAQIETLRAKVKMSEERVKQASGGYNPPFQAMPKVPSLSMPLVTGPVNGSTNAAVAMRTNPNQIFHHSMTTIDTATTHQPRFKSSFSNNNKPVSFSENLQNNGVGNIITETSPMQRLGKQIGVGGSPSRAMPQAHTKPNRQE